MFRRMVWSQSMSCGRGRRLRLCCRRRPARACSRGRRSRFSMSRTTFMTTARALSRLRSGSRFLRLSRVPTRWTSGSMVASSSGSRSIRLRSSRSSASRWRSCTVSVGKYLRMSPSQRFTLGLLLPRPPFRSWSAYRASSVSSMPCRRWGSSMPPWPSPSSSSACLPRMRRHLRRYSSDWLSTAARYGMLGKAVRPRRSSDPVAQCSATAGYDLRATTNRDAR